MIADDKDNDKDEGPDALDALRPEVIRGDTEKKQEESQKEADKIDRDALTGSNDTGKKD